MFQPYVRLYMVFSIYFLQELVVALSHLVVQYESNFCTVALQFIEEEKNYTVPSPANTSGTPSSNTVQGRFWHSHTETGYTLADFFFLLGYLLFGNQPSFFTESFWLFIDAHIYFSAFIIRC